MVQVGVKSVARLIPRRPTTISVRVVARQLPLTSIHGYDALRVPAAPHAPEKRRPERQSREVDRARRVTTGDGYNHVGRGRQAKLRTVRIHPAIKHGGAVLGEEFGRLPALSEPSELALDPLRVHSLSSLDNLSGD